MTNNKNFYIYHDSDHGDIEIFTTLKAAKKYADKMWPDSSDEDWEEESGFFFREPYQEIYIRQIKN